MISRKGGWSLWWCRRQGRGFKATSYVRRLPYASADTASIKAFNGNATIFVKLNNET